MKAIVRTRQGSADHLQLQRVDRPIPEDNEVLVKVHAATVTAGDVVMGKIPAFAFVFLRLMGMRRKTVPGHEFSGIVEAIGKDVSHFKVGDEVFGTTTGLTVGANAEYVCLPEAGKSHVIVHKPDNISFEQAAALPIGAMTALQILHKADIQSGQKALIYGASGSVGTYAVQLARYFGAEVTGVCSTRNIEMLSSIGADHVIDYKHEDFTLNGMTYDVIFDTVGKISENDVKHSLAPNGTYLSTRTSTSESMENLSLIAQLAQEGHLKVVIDRCYPLAETADAYHYVESGHKTGNVVIQV